MPSAQPFPCPEASSSAEAAVLTPFSASRGGRAKSCQEKSSEHPMSRASLGPVAPCRRRGPRAAETRPGTSSCVPRPTTSLSFVAAVPTEVVPQRALDANGTSATSAFLTEAVRFLWIDLQAGSRAIVLMHVLPFYDEAAIGVRRGIAARVYQPSSARGRDGVSKMSWDALQTLRSRAASRSTSCFINSANERERPPPRRRRSGEVSP